MRILLGRGGKRMPGPCGIQPDATAPHSRRRRRRSHHDRPPAGVEVNAVLAILARRETEQEGDRALPPLDLNHTKLRGVEALDATSPGAHHSPARNDAERHPLDGHSLVRRPRPVLLPAKQPAAGQHQNDLPPRPPAGQRLQLAVDQ